VGTSHAKFWWAPHTASQLGASCRRRALESDLSWGAGAAKVVMESCVEAQLSVVLGEGVPRVVVKVHCADGGAEPGVVQTTIRGIVLPATARLLQGRLSTSHNTTMDALQHAGATGSRRHVQGQEEGAPELASLGAFRGHSGGWDTALSTWLAVQGLGGSELIGGDSAPWNIPRSLLLLRNMIQNSVEMRSRRMHMYTVRQLCLPLGARRVLLCVVRRTCVGKVRLWPTSPVLGVCSVVLRKPRPMWPPCYCGDLCSWLISRRCLSGAL
jgi:hypothetical protein